MPRPRLLDDAKRREICALISVGAGIDAAARYVGCNPTTIRRESGRNADFYEKLRQAELTAQLDPLRALRRAAGTHWRAAAWLLERTNPDRFARRSPDTVSPAQMDIAMSRFGEEIVAAIPDPNTRDEVLRRLEKAARAISREVAAIKRPGIDPRRAKRRAERATPRLSQPERIRSESLHQNEVDSTPQTARHDPGPILDCPFDDPNRPAATNFSPLTTNNELPPPDKTPTSFAR